MSSLNLGRIFGIRISLHYSWFFILILLAWSLATDYFPAEYGGFTEASYWAFGIAAGILLFACVLAHELSHSLVAKHHGLEVRGITLFFFGGVASADEEGLDPRKEFQIAIAGPLLSIALGGLFFILTLIPLVGPVFPIIDYLFKINLILAAFNMIPGFPLDGGRVFRAVAWKFTGSLRKATRYAATGGKIFGGVLMAAGIIFLFTGGSGGLWYILLGGFLYILANASYDQVLVKENLSGTKVADIMSREFTEANPEMSVEKFVDDYVKKGLQMFVVKHREEYWLLDFDELKKIPRQEWPVKQLKDAMVKVEPARESHDAWKALRAMQKQGANMLPVVKKKSITGVVTMDSLLRTASLR